MFGYTAGRECGRGSEWRGGNWSESLLRHLGAVPRAQDHDRVPTVRARTRALQCPRVSLYILVSCLTTICNTIVLILLLHHLTKVYLIFVQLF